ncbi:Uu.00g132800.m01.CDS01 [Anthostomella pinea]|uniref:Uu.00g132800.m01.CDS01 n=1 Tax=Anthostomella pinea TaxID=933095 RepID=A0AAI8VSW4_9PEZI|nr:Uu.00g132800.m01.CDS01 [Anthostomella pinea]
MGKHIPKLMPVAFDEVGLSKILYEIYVQMFIDEDWSLKFANINLMSIRNLTLVFYIRSSLSAFLRLVQSRVICDWDKTMTIFLSHVKHRPNAPMGMNYVQELCVYMHMLGVYSTEWMKTPRNTVQGTSTLGDSRDWKNMPTVVCITLRVPRTKLAVITAMKPTKLGTPSVHCVLQAPFPSTTGQWQNIFPACQYTFGSISTRGRRHSNSFEVDIVEDSLAWRGLSDLIVSYYVPTEFLLMEPRLADVGFGIHSTPASTGVFMPKLGPTLSIYQTNIGNTNDVYITRYAPNQTGVLSVPGFAADDMASPAAVGPGGGSSLCATADHGSGRITSFTVRLNITGEEHLTALQSGCQVHVESISPCHASAAIGGEHPLSFMYPMLYTDHGALAWNMPYINLQKSPVIDIKQPDKLKWLNPHVSMMHSARERALREDEGPPRSPGERLRLDFKESLHSLFNHFAGLQGPKYHMFGIWNPNNGGVHILIFCSNLLIDLSNRVVALDCAVLPLHTDLMPKVTHFLTAIAASGLCQIKVDDAELRLWKRYAAAGKIPLTEEDERPFLCSCGNGQLPPKFIGIDVAGWNSASRYAVRAAISPVFWAAFVDENFRPSDGSIGASCNVCKEGSANDGGELKVYGGCHNVKYCSPACQRADWKLHKVLCKK